MNPFSTLIHLTDTHLGDGPDARLWGRSTELSCAAVIRDMRERFGRVDRVIHTGDVTHDAGEPAMARMRAMLAPLGAAVDFTPGNHDLPDILPDRVLDAWLPGWRVLLVSSRKPGAAEGRVSDADLAWLDAALGRSDSPVVLGLHHPPLALGTPWLDRIGLENADALWRVVRRHARVRAILHGHAHMERTVALDGVLVLGTPATTGQFRPHAERFTLDDQSPGYRWLRLWRDGRLETGVIRAGSAGS